MTVTKIWVVAQFQIFFSYRPPLPSPPPRWGEGTRESTLGVKVVLLPLPWRERVGVRGKPVSTDDGTWQPVWSAGASLCRVRRCHCWQPPPLRTVRATFTAHGSSKSVLIKPLPPVTHQLGLVPRFGLQQFPVASNASKVRNFCFALWPIHLLRVGTLSGRVLPYPAGYEFPLPFGCWHSLLAASLTHWGNRPSLRLDYWTHPDPIGVILFRICEMRTA